MSTESGPGSAVRDPMGSEEENPDRSPRVANRALRLRPAEVSSYEIVTAHFDAAAELRLSDEELSRLDQA